MNGEGGNDVRPQPGGIGVPVVLRHPSDRLPGSFAHAVRVVFP